MLIPKSLFYYKSIMIYSLERYYRVKDLCNQTWFNNYKSFIIIFFKNSERILGKK